MRKAGPSTDQTVANLEHLLDEYYRSLGYTDRGIPAIDRLQELDLPEAAEKIKAFTATGAALSPGRSGDP